MPDAARPALIPLPVSVVPGQGAYTLTAGTAVAVDQKLPGAHAALRRLLCPATGFALHSTPDAAAAGIRIQHVQSLPAEGYRLTIDASGISLAASTDAGAQFALQTLRQLLPCAIYASQPSDTVWSVPAMQIEDQPRFAWRGMHLDVARHFMPVAFIKRFIDLLSVHKFNRFHWHLTDDQGWRIEIRRYPELTRVGSRRAQTVLGHPLGKPWGKPRYDGVPHAGHYSQEEIREVVAYAAERHIVVVPEIEFPGHAQAAIAAYPSLGNTGAAVGVKEGWGISRHIVNPSDATLDFYRNVLDEVVALFPSPYIHIGGDEVLKREWRESEPARARMRELGLADADALQGWLIRQLSEHLAQHGRRLVGWDEIAGGDPGGNALLMSWRGTRRGLQAAIDGHEVVMTPTRFTYFDYYQADKRSEPLALGFYLPLQRVYEFDPAPATLAPSVRRRIIGVQGQLWTEFMQTPEHVEYMAFPRVCALSEVAWSSQQTRDTAHFKRRLSQHLARLDVLEVRYRPPGNDAPGWRFRLEAWLWRAGMWLLHRFSG
tara:strand:- start:3934 stop:5565 length:1632 start_codon:yes stop_codon:yes gene_type:complete